MPVLNLQVSASADDAHQQGSGVAPDIGGGSVGRLDAADEWGGFRWQATIPIGATINSAIFSGCFFNPAVDQVAHDLDFETSDDAPAFTTAVGNLENRTLTGSPVFWDDADLGAVGHVSPDPPEFFSAPDLSVPLQAVVDRPGRAETFNLVLIIVQPVTSTDRDFSVHSWDHDPAHAAKLDIDYSVGTTFNASAVLITFTITSPAFNQAISAGAITEAISIIAPAFSQTFQASPVSISLTSINAGFGQSIQATAQSLTLTPALATFIEENTFAASPVAISLNVGQALFQQVYQASPVVLSLTAVPFSLQFKAIPIVMQLSVIGAAFSQAIAASPVGLIMTVPDAFETGIPGTGNINGSGRLKVIFFRGPQIHLKGSV